MAHSWDKYKQKNAGNCTSYSQREKSTPMGAHHSFPGPSEKEIDDDPPKVGGMGNRPYGHSEPGSESCNSPNPYHGNRLPSSSYGDSLVTGCFFDSLHPPSPISSPPSLNLPPLTPVSPNKPYADNSLGSLEGDASMQSSTFDHYLNGSLSKYDTIQNTIVTKNLIARLDQPRDSTLGRKFAAEQMYEIEPSPEFDDDTLHLNCILEQRREDEELMRQLREENLQEEQIFFDDDPSVFHSEFINPSTSFLPVSPLLYTSATFSVNQSDNVADSDQNDREFFPASYQGDFQLTSKENDVGLNLTPCQGFQRTSFQDQQQDSQRTSLQQNFQPTSLQQDSQKTSLQQDFQTISLQRNQDTHSHQEYRNTLSIWTHQNSQPVSTQEKEFSDSESMPDQRLSRLSIDSDNSLITSQQLERRGIPADQYNFSSDDEPLARSNQFEWSDYRLSKRFTEGYFLENHNNNEHRLGNIPEEVEEPNYVQ